MGISCGARPCCSARLRCAASLILCSALSPLPCASATHFSAGVISPVNSAEAAPMPSGRLDCCCAKSSSLFGRASSCSSALSIFNCSFSLPALPCATLVMASTGVKGFSSLGVTSPCWTVSAVSSALVEVSSAPARVSTSAVVSISPPLSFCIIASAVFTVSGSAVFSATVLASTFCALSICVPAPKPPSAKPRKPS